MPWYVAAAVITGGATIYAADKASETSDKVVDEADRRKAEWDELYGDLEQNVADYYGSLDPDELAAEGLQAEAEGYAKTKEKIQVQLAQRGMGGGGLEAGLAAKQELHSAERRADIRAGAEGKVAEEQAGFLSGVKGEKAAAQAAVDTAQSAAASEAAAAESAAWESTAQIVGAGAKHFASKPPAVTPTVAAPSIAQQQYK